jgi:hypothetical protein
MIARCDIIASADTHSLYLNTGRRAGVPRLHGELRSDRAPSYTQLTIVTLDCRRRSTVPLFLAVRASRLRKTNAVFCGLVAVLWFVALAAQAPTIDTSSIGPPVGQKVPDYSGTDQLGRKHTLASSLGPKGAMLVFFRSADW